MVTVIGDIETYVKYDGTNFKEIEDGQKKEE